MMNLIFQVAVAATPVPLRIPSSADPLGDLPVNQAQKQLPAQPQVDLTQLIANAHKTPIAQNYPWLTHGMAGLFFLLAVSLIFLLAIQTTKQEGLSGTIGGRVESAYRTRLGADAQLARVTSYVALSMAFVGTLLALSGI
jgi:preprotein translocase subunit SecG